MAAVERPDASDIAPRLLEILRSDLEMPELDWAVPPTLLGDGVTARAFACQLRGASGLAATPLVCRVFCDGDDALPPDQVAVESGIQNALAAEGFPAPRVIAHGDADRGLGLPFMVMERAEGWNGFSVLQGVAVPALVLALFGIAAPLLVALVGYWFYMARLLRRLHGVSGARVAAALEEAGIARARVDLDPLLASLADGVRGAGSPGAGRVLEWLERQRPDPPEPPVVCHGDYWFGNLMVSRSRVVLLDWTQAALAHRELDLGWIAIQHHSRVPLPLADPLFDWLWLPVRPLTWLLMAPVRFLYAMAGGVDRERVRYFSVLRALGLLTQGAQLRKRAPGGAVPPLLQAWGSPHTVALLRRHVRRITGFDPGAF